MEGLVEFCALDSCVAILFMELAVLPHIAGLWSPDQGLLFFSMGSPLISMSMLRKFEMKRESRTLPFCLFSARNPLLPRHKSP